MKNAVVKIDSEEYARKRWEGTIDATNVSTSIKVNFKLYKETQ